MPNETSKIRILFLLAKPFGFVALTTFIFTHTSASAGAAEVLRLGFSGASATQLAGYLAVEQKLVDIYRVHVEVTQEPGTRMIGPLDSGRLEDAIGERGQAVSAY